MKILETKVGFEAIGGLPLVAAYLQKLNFIKTIDDMVEPLRSNHRRMTHGETCFVMILYFLFKSDAVYKMEEWVLETTYLRSIFPNIKGEYFNDDRIADTFDALYKCGSSNIFSAQSVQAISQFGLKVEQVHCDLTNFSVYGDFDNDEGIEITYGKPKSGRTDQKQYALESAVTGDGIPIIQTTLDGNTADVTRYIPMWQGVKNVLGNSDFIFVGDCKLTSERNLAIISSGDGYYLGPLAMYSSLQSDLRRFVLEEKRPSELLLEHKKSDTLTINYAGFEIEDWIRHPDTNQAFFQRKIFILSSQLRGIELNSLDNRILKTEEEFEKIKKQLNTAKYNTIKLIDEAVKKTLTKYKLPLTSFKYSITEYSETIKKKIGKGRIGPNTKFTEEVVKKYSLEISKCEDVLASEMELCGYFVLTTNKSKNSMSAKEALVMYKAEWKVERIFSRLKGKLQVLPVHLKLPHRIESLMFLLMTCAQIFTLMDLMAKKTLANENRKLEGLFPNKIKVAHPKAEYMLDSLRNIGLVYTLQGNEVAVKVTGIDTLQMEIFKITQADCKYISTETVAKMLDISEKLDGAGLIEAINTKFVQKKHDTAT